MNKKLLGYAVLIIVLVGGGILWNRNRHADDTTNTSNTTTNQVSSNIQPVTYEGVDGQTALALLQSTHTVEVKHYDFGDMVISIDNVPSQDGVNFWEFLVNGKQATQGADSYVTSAGEQITWQLTPINVE